MDKIYDLTVNANDGNIFKYTVDTTGMLINYGSQLNDVNVKPIEGIIKLITKEIVEKMIKNADIVKELDNNEWNYEGMEGKYFDNEGYIYRNIKNEIYPSIWKSKYLCKYFKEL